MSQSANNGGLFLTSASNNTITNNIFFRNQDHGIFLHGTSNNLITDNVFENNSVGIYCSWWKNQLNQIFHNNFIKNDINAIDETMNNSWDNGKEGNYWNDYHGSDSNNDGIGDIPYNISGGSNKDSYPLIYPWYSTHPNTVFIDDDFDENTTGWGFDKFNRIQYGINEVPENGIVYVYNGIYYENLHIAKSINLLGENKEFTIIDGSGGKDVINIEADKVTITGFTIQNNNWTNYGAIAVRFSDSARIFKNIIKSNKCGVYLYWSNSNYVSNNTIYNNLNYGFSLINSHDNDISKNYLINNSISIQFAESNRNIISNNIIFNNSGGVELWLSYNNKFLKNTFMNNYWDAVFQSSGNKIFFHRNIWRNNYWNRLRYFPKPIFGMLMWGEDLQIRIPWLQFDWHPAQEPYDIEVR